MRVRIPFGVDTLMLVVLSVGLAGFVALHSYVLVNGDDEVALALIRLSWFAGLGLVVALSAYASFARSDG